MKPIIELIPESDVLQVSSIKQSMQEVTTNDIIPCAPLRTRLLHEIVISNHNFSIKHMFKLTYTSDSEKARICKKDHSCDQLVIREFPGRQMYWSGERKSLAELLCWSPTRSERDFNLQIEVEDQPYSLGIDPKTLEQLNDRVLLVAHCEYPEDSF